MSLQGYVSLRARSGCTFSPGYCVTCGKDAKAQRRYAYGVALALTTLYRERGRP